MSWEVTNKVIFAICIDPSSTINPTKFLLANIVILFNLFSLVCVWRNPYFNVKVHSRGSQSHFLTTTSHISICQHIASITQNSQKVFLTASRKYFYRKGDFVRIESIGQHKVSTYLSVKNTKSNLAGRTSKKINNHRGGPKNWTAFEFNTSYIVYHVNLVFIDRLWGEKKTKVTELSRQWNKLDINYFNVVWHCEKNKQTNKNKLKTIKQVLMKSFCKSRW